MNPGSVWGGEAGSASGAVRLVPDLLPMHSLVCAESSKRVRNEPALRAHVVPKCGWGRGRGWLWWGWAAECGQWCSRERGPEPFAGEPQHVLTPVPEKAETRVGAPEGGEDKHQEAGGPKAGSAQGGVHARAPFVFPE